MSIVNVNKIKQAANQFRLKDFDMPITDSDVLTQHVFVDVTYYTFLLMRILLTTVCNTTSQVGKHFSCGLTYMSSYLIQPAIFLKHSNLPNPDFLKFPVSCNEK